MASSPAGPSFCDGLPSQNFCVCDSRYGSQLNEYECGQAVAKVRDLPFSNRSPPWSTQEGNCFVTVELAGPTPETIDLAGSEDIVQYMALSLLRICTKDQGLGGFLTAFLSRLMGWALDPAADMNAAIRVRGLDYGLSVVPPPNASFVTVTIHGPNEKTFAPGNTDPKIAQLISSKLEEQWKSTTPWTSRWALLMDGSNTLLSRAASMVPGGTETWFRPDPRPNNRIGYDCDPKLGSPLAIDCARLAQTPVQDMMVRPGDTAFIVLKTCSVAISVATVATDAISITWPQIRAALDLLINGCVGLSSGTAHGGRTHGGLSLHFNSGHLKDKRNSSDSTVKSTANNPIGQSADLGALPPNVNVTVFEQTEAFTTYAAERRSCPWRAIQNGDDVKHCSQEL